MDCSLLLVDEALKLQMLEQVMKMDYSQDAKLV
jgi:hypothetical protein